jgi:hypothetical protein
VVELLVLGSLAFVALFVLAVLASVFGLVMWLVFLPFRILGWICKGLALIIALPFVAMFGVVAAVALGAGVLMFLLPFLPIALVVLGAWWLVRRNQRSAAAATQ